MGVWLPSRQPLDKLRRSVDRVKDFFPIFDFGLGNPMVSLTASEDHDASRHDGTRLIANLKARIILIPSPSKESKESARER